MSSHSRQLTQGDPVGRLTLAARSPGKIDTELDALWARMRQQEAGQAELYRSPAYLDFAKSGSGDATCALLTFDDALGAIVGLAPIRLGNAELAFTWGFLKLARLRFRALAVLGSEPLLSDGIAPGPVFLALSENGGDYDAIELEYLREDSALWAYIRQSDALRRSFIVYVVDGFRPCHYVEVPASLDKYYRSFSRKRRYNLMRQERLLKARIGGEVELIKVYSRENFPILEDAIRACSGWDQRETSAELHRLSVLCDNHLLCCYVLKSDMRPIALALGCLHRNSLHIMRLLHDQSLNSVSPGTTMWQILLRDIIGKKEFDIIYMGYGEPQYRFKNTNQIRQMGRILLLKRTPANAARVVVHWSYCWIKQLAKSVSRQRAPRETP